MKNRTLRNIQTHKISSVAANVKTETVINYICVLYLQTTYLNGYTF